MGFKIQNLSSRGRQKLWITWNKFSCYGFWVDHFLQNLFMMFHQVCLESSPSQFSNTDTGKNQICCLKAQVSINKDG